MKLIYVKSALKCDSFEVAIGIKIPFFRVLVSIEPGRSLLQLVTTNCLMFSLYFCFYEIYHYYARKYEKENYKQRDIRIRLKYKG